MASAEITSLYASGQTSTLVLHVLLSRMATGIEGVRLGNQRRRETAQNSENIGSREDRRQEKSRRKQGLTEGLGLCLLPD